MSEPMTMPELVDCECGGGKTGCAECFGDGFRPVTKRLVNDLTAQLKAERAEVRRLRYAFERVSEEEDKANAALAKAVDILRTCRAIIDNVEQAPGTAAAIRDFVAEHGGK